MFLAGKPTLERHPCAVSENVTHEGNCARSRASELLRSQWRAIDLENLEQRPRSSKTVQTLRIQSMSYGMDWNEGDKGKKQEKTRSERHPPGPLNVDVQEGDAVTPRRTEIIVLCFK